MHRYRYKYKHKYKRKYKYKKYKPDLPVGAPALVASPACEDLLPLPVIDTDIQVDHDTVNDNNDNDYYRNYDDNDNDLYSTPL